MLSEEHEIYVRIVFSFVGGAVIGLQREFINKFYLFPPIRGMAGIRTHIIVCMCCCLLQCMSIYAYSDIITGSVNRDPARLSTGCVVGVGFLGAGVIFHPSGRTVHGLTTATTIFLSMAIGLCIGIGWYIEAIIAGSIALLTLILLSGDVNISLSHNTVIHVTLNINKTMERSLLLVQRMFVVDGLISDLNGSTITTRYNDNINQNNSNTNTNNNGNNDSHRASSQLEFYMRLYKGVFLDHIIERVRSSPNVTNFQLTASLSLLTLESLQSS